MRSVKQRSAWEHPWGVAGGAVVWARRWWFAGVAALDHPGGGAGGAVECARRWWSAGVAA